jgi:hypothetical protein
MLHITTRYKLFMGIFFKRNLSLAYPSGEERGNFLVQMVFPFFDTRTRRGGVRRRRPVDPEPDPRNTVSSRGVPRILPGGMTFLPDLPPPPPPPPGGG